MSTQIAASGSDLYAVLDFSKKSKKRNSSKNSEELSVESTRFLGAPSIKSFSDMYAAIDYYQENVGKCK